MLAESPKGGKWDRYILHRKAYLYALVLTIYESRKFTNVSQKQSNGNAPIKCLVCQHWL